MSENAAPGRESATNDTAQNKSPVFDEDYVKGLRAEAAKYRTEAKANAEAAKELAALRDAQKSEAEKVADRIKSLEDSVKSSKIEALRAQIAAKNGIDPEDAAILLTGSDEETLTAQAARLAKVKPQTAPRSPHEGKEKQDQKSGTEEPMREVAQQLFNRS